MISIRLPAFSWRRCIAALLAITGLSLLAIPFFLSHARSMPVRPSTDAAGLALQRMLAHDLPLRLDPASAFPGITTLPGAPFRPVPVAVTMPLLTAGIPPGDYSVPVVGFNLPYGNLQAGEGVAYQLGPMQGKASEAIATLLWRGLASGATPASLYPTACAIQSGVPYRNMPGSFRVAIDQFIPDLKESISGDFFETMQTTYARAVQVAPSSLSLRQAIIAGGPLGRSAMEAVNERAILLRPGLNEPQRKAMIVFGDSYGIYTPAKREESPWTEAVPGIAFMRLRLNAGNPTTGMLDLRIVPPWEASPASAGAPRELPTLMELFGARFASGGKVRVAGLVGYSLTHQSQPVTFYPVIGQ